MDNKNNDAEKAIIQLGKIFKIFAAVAVVLIIALCIYLASNADLGNREQGVGLRNLSPIPYALSLKINPS